MSKVMTKHIISPVATSDKDFRKDMMRVMSEVTLNPANVVSEKQEELAMFMVHELKSHQEESTTESTPWEL